MRTESAPLIVRLTWEEVASLLVCLGLDFIEYVFPPLMAPLIGDILDITGVAFSLFFFGPLGLISLAEIVPGLDVLPFFTITWLAWYLWKRRRHRLEMEDQLERWK